MAEQKRYYTTDDIMMLYNVGRPKAQQIMREAKWLTGNPKGKLGKGKIFPAELELWERNVGGRT